MGFSIVCHECGYSLYEGMDMIVLYRLRGKIDNKCPGCGRTLSLHPLSIEIEDKETNKSWLIEKPELVHKPAAEIATKKILILKVIKHKN